MKMKAVILDRTLLEQVVTGFREDEFEIVGFKMLNVERKGNSLVWKFKRTFTKDECFTSACGKFMDQEVVKYFTNISIVSGDWLMITYKLSWKWRGGGDGPSLRYDYPVPGAEIEFYCLAA